MSESFTISAFIPATPLQVYAAWLDGDQHTEMTGGESHGEPVVGSAFDAWDGYIHGMNLELEPARRIVQSWRSAEFPDDAPDSRLELLLENEGDGTRVTLRHWDIPPGQAANYEKGWHEHYFTPMREYFIRRGLTRVMSADQAQPAGASVQPAKPEWERPDDKEEMDDWSSESEQEVGWEAPQVEEPADEPADDPAEAPAPVTLQAERPFLEPPKPAQPKPERKKAERKPVTAGSSKPARKPARKPVKKKAVKARPAKGAAKKKAAKARPAKGAAKKKAAKARPAKGAAKKKAAPKKKAPRARHVRGGAKKKTAPKRKAAKKRAAKKSASARTVRGGAKKKPILKKKAAKKKPARKATRGRPASAEAKRKAAPKKKQAKKAAKKATKKKRR